jgi:alpha-tubulin suppressor-like RCC1 family protein
VPAAAVRFSVLAGGGIAAPSRTRTDSLGLASVLWRLGMEPGQQELSASSIELPGTITFTATAHGRPVVTRDGTIIARAAAPVRVQPRSFVVGGSHACTLVGGRAVCRGSNDRGQGGSAVGSGFVALASGISHTCALDADGVAMCWGANDGGQLGDGSREDRPSPVPVRAELRFESLTAGTAHTCGLASGGLAVCWGENLSGQLGDGTRTDARFPRAVGGGLTFSSLAAGWSHTCGLTANGNAFCWGLNSDGQLGDASRLDRLVPTLVRGSITSLAAGSAHTCGIDEADVLCWGANRFGQLGDGTNEGRMQPVPVQGLPGRARAVTSGAVHTCALMADGAAYCWGQNIHGQLGDGTTQNRNRPVRVAGGVAFRSIESGGALTCAFAMDGTEYCWGLNQSGQIGDGTRESRSTPTRVQR